MKAYMYTVLSKVFDLESVHLEGVPKTFFFCCNVGVGKSSEFFKCMIQQGSKRTCVGVMDLMLCLLMCIFAKWF